MCVLSLSRTKDIKKVFPRKVHIQKEFLLILLSLSHSLQTKINLARLLEVVNPVCRHTILLLKQKFDSLPETNGKKETKTNNTRRGAKKLPSENIETKVVVHKETGMRYRERNETKGAHAQCRCRVEPKF